MEATPEKDSKAQEIAVLKEALKDREEALSEERKLRQEGQTRIRQLEDMLLTLRRKHFGPSSEKDDRQLGLFNEAEELADEPVVETTEVKPHTRQKSAGRPSLPKDLPREEVVYDLPDEDKVCPHDGTALKEIAPKTSEQLEIIPAQMKVIVHTRKQYACPCCEKHVATASKPKQPLGKSFAGPGLLAWVMISKYCDALPLYRQCTMFQRLGITLDRTTLANWMIRCGQLIQPLINRLTEHIVESSVVHMDETTTQVLKEPDKRADSKSYMWVLGAGVPGARTVVFNYDPSRRQAVPRQLLNDYRGALMVDGYEGYGPVCVENSITRLGCMAHVRRKFMDAKKLLTKGKVGKADQALSWIQKLYLIERQAKDMIAEQRHQLRQDKAVPLLAKFKQWLDKSHKQVLPSSPVGKAVAYALGQWERVERYVEDGDYPIDNNAVENAIRPFAIGRKNWLFSTSQAGANASANIYSLVETAKGHGIEPYHYLKEVLKALPNAETLEDIDALLPMNVKNGKGAGL